MEKITAIIIDDEKLARENIKAHLKELSTIDLLDECKDGFEGLKKITELKPDLVFLDIQMPKLTGLELLELLDDPPLIIFSTAYDEYALKAFEQNAVDYLLKPYSKERFREAVDKALQKLGNDQKPLQRNLIETHHNTRESLQRIVVKNGHKIEVIPIEDIEYFEAEDDYVSIHTRQGKFLKQITMKYLESHLPKGEFIRIHRSYILSVKEIDRLENYEKGTHIIKTRTGDLLPVSKTGYSRLKDLLNF
jgi:two-component system, LytTR family, response regulator